MRLDSVSFGHIFWKKLKDSNQKMKGLLFPLQKTSENVLEEEETGEGTKSTSLEPEKSRFLETLGNFVFKFKFNYLKTEMLASMNQQIAYNSCFNIYFIKPIGQTSRESHQVVR